MLRDGASRRDSSTSTDRFLEERKGGANRRQAHTPEDVNGVKLPIGVRRSSYKGCKKQVESYQ